MQSFSFKAYKLYSSFFLIGLLILGPLQISSFAAESRVGFVDIQKAVINTKEWKKEFEGFKKNFAKEKKGEGSVQDLLNAGDTWTVS